MQTEVADSVGTTRNGRQVSLVVLPLMANQSTLFYGTPSNDHKNLTSARTEFSSRRKKYRPRTH